MSIVGNILLRKKMIVTFPLQVVACDFLLGPSNRGQARLAGACSQANLVAMVRLTDLFTHSLYICTVGTREVGIYDYSPPTLILKGNSGGSNAPAVLEYVHWPGTLCYVPKNSLCTEMTLRVDKNV